MQFTVPDRMIMPYTGMPPLCIGTSDPSKSRTRPCSVAFPPNPRSEAMASKGPLITPRWYPNARAPMPATPTPRDTLPDGLWAPLGPDTDAPPAWSPMGPAVGLETLRLMCLCATPLCPTRTHFDEIRAVQRPTGVALDWKIMTL